jgi:hypothetical protein
MMRMVGASNYALIPRWEQVENFQVAQNARSV